MQRIFLVGRFSCLFFFLVFRCAVASLYEVVSVRPSVRRSVRPSVGPSVRPVLFSKVKRTHTRRILCRVSGLVSRSLCRICSLVKSSVYRPSRLSPPPPLFPPSLSPPPPLFTPPPPKSLPLLRFSSFPCSSSLLKLLVLFLLP